MVHPATVANPERIISEVGITSTDAIGLISDPSAEIATGTDRDGAADTLPHPDDGLVRVECPITIGVRKDDPPGLPDAGGIRRAARTGRSADHHPNPPLDRFGTRQIERGNQLVGLGDDPIVENQFPEGWYPDGQHDRRHRQGHDQLKQGKTGMAVHESRNTKQVWHPD